MMREWTFLLNDPPDIYRPRARTDISQTLDHLREIATTHPAELREMQWRQTFKTLGTCSLCLHEGEFRCESFIQMLIKKGQDYGPEPIRRWGPLGVLIRIDSKFQRYLNLTETATLTHNFEPVEDTIIDMIGYSVLGIALADELDVETY